MKSLYIHIPFCTNICSYCDFCKLIYKEDLVLDDGEFYIEDLIGFDVIIDEKIVGKVTGVMYNSKANDNLRVGDILLPYVKDLIIKIEDNKIYYKSIGGLY